VFGTYPDDFEAIAATGGDLKSEMRHQVINVSLIGQRVVGHAFWIPALAHFHIYPSLSGCPGRTSTSANSEARGCMLATNAGFFNMETGACIGNIVSDGKVVETQDLLRASFGLTKSGKLVAGYVNATSAKSGDYLQLVQGAGWLVRNGVSYIATSAKKENIGTSFVALLAPRLAFGFDKHGAMMVVEVDGTESKKLGLDLKTFAQLIVELGGHNVVNLDGGGSVTIVWDKRVCTAGGNGYDPCIGPKQQEEEKRIVISNTQDDDGPYERPVTTISCFK